MIARQSKSAFLYLEVRRALRSGTYVPGQRIDPATLAEEFHASATPVRFALYRLVGEGLIADHGRSGLHVPLPTEVMLRDQYDWMRRLLQMACTLCFDAARPRTEAEMVVAPEDDLPNATWEFFDGIARATDHHSLHRAVEQANDRLAPVRRIGLGLIDDAFDELASLIGHWRDRNEQALLVGLDAYHERRAQLVPHIVALLGDGVDFFR